MTTDRLTLTRALQDSGMLPAAAERVATEIYAAIHDNVATKTDLRELEQRLERPRAVIAELARWVVISIPMMLPAAISMPAVAQSVCAHMQSAYDICFQQFIREYPGLKRQAEQYPEGSRTRHMIERTYGIEGLGPEDFARSQCKAVASQMWEMGCPEGDAPATR